MNAANLAAAISKRLDEKLLLCHGVDGLAGVPRHLLPGFKASSQASLSAEAARLRLFGVDVQEELALASPARSVVHCAENANARLIVLGSEGTGALERWILGSTVERVAESAPVPTLVMRDSEPLQAWIRGESPLNVFIGADFTPASDAALQWVSELRQLGPCKITLGFVDRDPEEPVEVEIHRELNFVAGFPPARVKSEQDLRIKAERWLGVEPVFLRVVSGAPRVDSNLLKMAKDSAADLIVVGTHQWHGVNRVRHPSVSRRVLQGARTNVACIPSPDMVVGPHAALPEVRRVLVATDLSPAGVRMVSHAYSVLGAAGGTVGLLHVVHPGEPAQDELAALRKLVPDQALLRGIRSEFSVVEAKDITKAICEAADRFDADIVCVGIHGKTGLRSFHLGSVTRELITRSRRPVLVVHPPGS